MYARVMLSTLVPTYVPIYTFTKAVSEHHRRKFEYIDMYTRYKVRSKAEVAQSAVPQITQTYCSNNSIYAPASALRSHIRITCRIYCPM